MIFSALVGALSVLLFGVFLSFIVVKVNDIALTVIVVGVMVMAVIDYVQTVREERESANNGS